MYGSHNKLTLAQQHFGLRWGAVGGKGGVIRNRLEWQFTAQPTPLSRRYQVRLSYALGGAPQVLAISPDLVDLAAERRLPHVYSDKPVRLCLYLPASGEWHARMSLAATVIPWTYLWFYYFEDWLESDVWRGGGQHPPRGSDTLGAPQE
jgi:hypothetical protein